MKKILVPTDFSVNSKAGIRFALQWARQQKLELVFIHVLYLLRPTRWSDDYFEQYAAGEEKDRLEKLEDFIAGIYKTSSSKPGKYRCVVRQGTSADLAILDYCKKNPGFDCICISTRGAGKLKKLFGTNTGNLITKSPVPVMAVPANYRVGPIETVLYATDFRNYTGELKKVVAFARPLKLKVELLHFTMPNEILLDKKLAEATFKKEFRYDLTLHIEKTDLARTLVSNLEHQVRRSKPSVVIMFTNQKRSFFEKLFLSSKAESFSFEAKVPLLVFSKP